jgi:hypothetical protein
VPEACHAYLLLDLAGTRVETTGISTQIESACRAMVQGVREPRTCSHGDSSQGFNSRLERKVAMPDSRSSTAQASPWVYRAVCELGMCGQKRRIPVTRTACPASGLWTFIRS